MERFKNKGLILGRIMSVNTMDNGHVYGSDLASNYAMFKDNMLRAYSMGMSNASSFMNNMRSRYSAFMADMQPQYQISKEEGRTINQLLLSQYMPKVGQAQKNHVPQPVFLKI